MRDKRQAAHEFNEILLQAIEKGCAGDYNLCIAIVEAFRQHKGDGAANKVRRVLWEMIQEHKT
ncbi:hypothetical protein [Paraburkholderia caledonica]|uniref:Uncharacterized protein n=1 Tax=Paraburkholderia caledonica TaxID=134536 RepID=A0AB73ISJ7_9BURK|nr:hypothetical protein [Paraburkholderia caledonica]